MLPSMRFLAIQIALSATLVVTGAGCRDSQPAPEVETPLTIYFESDRDGDYDIYATDVRGGDPVDLTQNANQDVDAALSHDGTRIAFCSDRDRSGPGTDIWIMNADGSEPTRLTQAANARQPAWAPGDTALVFVSGSGDDAELVLIGLDGSHRAILTHNEVPDLDPAWSPDGRIVFRSDRDGDGEIFRMDPANGTIEQLTENDVLDEQPSVSRDGSRIYFVTQMSGKPEIAVMRSDRSHFKQITHGGASQPCAGTRTDLVVFVQDPWAGGDIALMTEDGGAIRRLTSGPHRELGPTW